MEYWKFTVQKWVFLYFFLIPFPVFSEDALNGLVLLMIDDTACPYCELWHEEIGYIYTKTEEGKAAPLLRVHYGESLPEGISLMNEPLVTPTFVILQDKIEKFRIEGYPGEEFFWSFLTEYLEKLKK